MIAVAATVAGLAAGLGRPASTDVASATDDAIVVELPPVEAAKPTAGSEAPDAASSASAATEAEAPTPQERPPPDKLPDPTEAQSPPPPIERPLPVAPDPALALPPPRPVPPPTPVVATAPPREALVPAGAQVPAAGEAQDSEAATAQRARRITLWQRSLMTHLETAKRSLAPARHPSGTVKVAFVIDDGGHLVSEHVASGSGSSALDATALTLVARAAPFPAPPAGTRGADLSFVVPVRFRR